MPSIALHGYGTPSLVLGGFGGGILSTFDEDLQAYLVDRLAWPVWAGHIPQLAELPAFSYFLVSESPFYYLAGPTVGLTSAIYQIDIWSTDYLQCTRLERRLRRVLHGFRGMMNTTKVSSSRLQTRFGQYETTDYASDNGTYHIAVEYRFLHSEPIPTFP